MNNIVVDVCKYIDERLRELEERINIKIDSLDDKYEKSELVVAVAKSTVDKHFEMTNQYQARLDKQAVSFTSSKDVDDKIKLAITGAHIQIKVIWAILVSILLIIVTEFIKTGGN